MSFLAPLYALGALAIVAPLIFHLIRRTPRGEVPFSSLMFLNPTPPRLTRRSRLDQILLLLLRATALILLAFAFARPFLRESARLDFDGGERRRIAVLLDTSASMRRADLWTRAKAAVDSALAACGPNDQVAVYAFDDATRPLLGFAEAATLDPSRRIAVAQSRIQNLQPGWGSTRLDQALIDTVGEIESIADATEKLGRSPRRIVLISDLQQGSRLEGLGDFEWPSDIALEIVALEAEGSNAGLQRAAESAVLGTETEAESAALANSVRIRVSNDAESRSESFTVQWADANGAASGDPLNVYVPPGESRVARIPRPADPAKGVSLRLNGDTHGYDNTVYLVPERREDATVLYLGQDAADDPAGLLYFLSRVFPDTPRRRVTIQAVRPSNSIVFEPGRSVPLVVLSGETSPANAKALREHAKSGATVLYVIGAPGRAETLATLAGVPAFDVVDGPSTGDALLSEIAFDHPVFAPMAGPQFNDFTKIHFWKRRKLDPKSLGDPKILARFEGGDPALLELPVEKGRILVMASGWTPADSQLARSSKFLPLMTSFLDGPSRRVDDRTERLVHQAVPIPTAPGTPAARVQKPDGSADELAAGAMSFAGTDLPGVYRMDAAGASRSFAVNLDPSESKTAPLAFETLEQFGCKLAKPGEEAASKEDRRQLKNAELEGRQKLWRWLVVATLAVLTVETWLAGRQTRPQPARAEALTT